MTVKTAFAVVLLFLLVALVIYAQVTPSINIVRVNGIASSNPSFIPGPGTGFQVTFSGGKVFCNGALSTDPGPQSFTVAASSTTFFYLDPSAACALSNNTTGFPTNSV